MTPSVITRVRNRPGVGRLPAAHQPPVEDQRDLVGSADVEVVADDLFEEDPPGHRLVQHLGQGELGLQDRDVVAVAGGPVGGAERVRQDRQPLAQQRVDLVGSELVADGLQRPPDPRPRRSRCRAPRMRCRPWRPGVSVLVGAIQGARLIHQGGVVFNVGVVRSADASAVLGTRPGLDGVQDRF